MWLDMYTVWSDTFLIQSFISIISVKSQNYRAGQGKGADEGNINYAVPRLFVYTVFHARYKIPYYTSCIHVVIKFLLCQKE